MNEQTDICNCIVAFIKEMMMMYNTFITKFQKLFTIVLVLGLYEALGPPLRQYLALGILSSIHFLPLAMLKNKAD